MKMPGRLLVGHELFSRGNYAKIASSRFLEEKKKKEMESNLDLHHIDLAKSPIPFLFENLSSSFALRNRGWKNRDKCFNELEIYFSSRNIILCMAHRVNFFCCIFCQ